MAAAAILAGCRSVLAVAEWAAEAPQPVLAAVGARRDPRTSHWQAPSEDTFRRLLARVDAAAVDQVIALPRAGTLARRVRVGLVRARGRGPGALFSGVLVRSHRIDGEEFYRLLDGVMIDDTKLFNDKLAEWEAFYNYHRPHGGLGGQTPYERLKQKTQTAVQRSTSVAHPCSLACLLVFRQVDARRLSAE